MIKKIKELTAAEIDHYCDDRRDQNQTNKPYNACVACPLRWARQCSTIAGAAQKIYGEVMDYLGIPYKVEGGGNE